MPDPELDRLKARYVQVRLAVLSAATPLDKADALTSLVNVVGQLAAHAPTPDLQQRWMIQHNALADQAAALRDEVAAEVDDPPSELLQSLDKFSDAALSFGGTVASAAGGIVTGLGDVGRALPLLLLVALVVAGIAGVGYVRHGGVTVRRA